MTTEPEPTQSAASDPELLERLRAAAGLLEAIAADTSVLDRLPTADRQRLQRAVAQVYHPDPALRRQRLKAAERERNTGQIRRDDALLDNTGIRALRRKPVFTTPNVFAPENFVADDVDGEQRQSLAPQHCYVCKQKYSQVHHFYDQLCPDCAELNYRKRGETADLTGRVALLTGGRVKIGYQAGLKLLRAGARLIVTTRFPRDSAARYAAEPDFAQWSDRLEIFGLDLRHTPSVEAFCRELLATHERLDFIINNACQTVRRPPAFYAHMMAGETAARDAAPPAVRKLLGAYEGLRSQDLFDEVDASALAITPRASDGQGSAHTGHAPGLTRAAELSQIPLLADELLGQKHLFPEGRLDQDLQQVDLRGRNSWRLLMAEVPSVELLEVQLVNAIAPFIINARLKPLM
ncbi:MAG: SDR family NAD(P)-dependent oxidoreductase, partial [Arenimonas sp.]